MKYRIETVDDHNAMYYGLVLKDFNLCIAHEKGEKYTDIELNSLEDLERLRLAVDHYLIIKEDNKIEIYDYYRE